MAGHTEGGGQLLWPVARVVPSTGGSGGGRTAEGPVHGQEDGATIAREQSGLIAKQRRRPDGAGAAQRRGGGSRTRSEDGGDATTRGAGIRTRSKGGGAVRATGRECAWSREGGASDAGGGRAEERGRGRGCVRRLSVVCLLLNRGRSVCRPTGRLYIFDSPSSTRGKVALTRAE